MANMLSQAPKDKVFDWHSKQRDANLKTTVPTQVGIQIYLQTTMAMTQANGDASNRDSRLRGNDVQALLSNGS